MPLDVDALARRAEEAGLNASTPPQQAQIEGWLLRLSPGKAKRSRCVNALAAGTLPLDDLLGRCQQSFAAAGLPLIVRVTPFSQPTDLDTQLATRGWFSFDAADVMVLDSLPAESPRTPKIDALDADAYARIVGELRGSSAREIEAHAERLKGSPVPYRGFALRDGASSDGALLACGQYAREDDIVGLFDIFTPAERRGRGHAAALCTALLLQAKAEGASRAYLQVGSDNTVAQRVYARLGFRFAYRYHYRAIDPLARD